MNGARHRCPTFVNQPATVAVDPLVSRLVDELQRDLLDIAAIGADDEGGGVTRLAWSKELLQAYAWLARRGREIGVSHDIDTAGNAFLRWAAGTGPALLIGSHLDTVPRGGRFDGALGVLTGLDVLRTLRRDAFAPRCPIWLTAFMDEEGTRFGTALFGSRALAGEDLSQLGDRGDQAGVTLREAMRACGFDFDAVPAAAQLDRVRGYLELHIEQGPVLEHSGDDVGIVTSIVGLIGLQVRLLGQANHAGTTPLALRRDALAGGARAVLELRDLARRTAGVTANVGTISVEPGGKNVVPGSCEFTVDIRSASPDVYRTLDDSARSLLQRIAHEETLELTVAEIYRLEPVPLDTAIIDTLERAAELEGASSRRLPSGAGHDAQVIASHVPTGMLFVPSRGGISHNPAEHTTPEQCALGSRVLARAVTLLASA